MSQPLTFAQELVIDMLSTGASVAAAAEAAGVHRNTIANWRRTVPAFTRDLASAQYDRCLHFRSRMQEHAELALSTVAEILVDPKTSPSIRLKAALAILKESTTLPPPEPALTDIAWKRKIAEIFDPALLPSPCAVCTERENMHNPAQSAQPAQPSYSLSGVETVRRAAPKTGRNEPCPCQSGKKYKQCCLMTMAA